MVALCKLKTARPTVKKKINIQDSEALEIWLKFCKTYMWEDHLPPPCLSVKTKIKRLIADLQKNTNICVVSCLRSNKVQYHYNLLNFVCFYSR